VVAKSRHNWARIGRDEIVEVDFAFSRVRKADPQPVVRKRPRVSKPRSWSISSNQWSDPPEITPFGQGRPVLHQLCLDISPRSMTRPRTRGGSRPSRSSSGSIPTSARYSSRRRSDPPPNEHLTRCGSAHRRRPANPKNS
jgi:hypothetical protein